MCAGPYVMLLNNYVVEWKLVNGSIGIVRGIVYGNSHGLNENFKHVTAYVIVEFTSASVPGHDILGEDEPYNWVPIPILSNKYEKICCLGVAIPLYLCISITIHKAQEVTISK